MTTRTVCRRYHAAVWDEPLVMQLATPAAAARCFRKWNRR